MKDFNNEDLERKMFEDHGFFVHVLYNKSYPLGLNIHTHGLPDRFDHPNIQIVCPFRPDIIFNVVLQPIITKISSGFKYDIKSYYESLIQPDGVKEKYQMKFINALESGSPVLRLIFPDQFGKLELDDIAEPFDKQYQKLRG